MREWKKMIGHCGIDCEHCDVYLATINHDEELRVKTAKLWSELNQCDIPAETLYCLGCRMDGVKTYYCAEMCEIKKCAEEKGFETCGGCQTLKSCALVKPILDFHQEAKENLLGE